MLTYTIKTFGCQMNYSDSERVANILESIGFKKAKNLETANLCIANTCSVRQKSEDKAYGFIVNWKKNNPKGIMAVTGCMVRQTGHRENSKDNLLKYDPIDLVFRIEDSQKLPKLLSNYFNEEFSVVGNGTLSSYFHIVPKVENKRQVFVPIMTGCNKFCAYCIVPYTRGREISRPIDEVFNECKKLVENGAIEITLLGQNVNSYTSDNKKCFPELLRKIDTLSKKGLSRLRFTSPHPQDFTDEITDTLATMKTSCPHIHLPAQHGSNQTLQAMNRNYTVEKYKSIVTYVRKKIHNVAITTDIIVGFPGETENDFQKLCNFAEQMRFDFSFTAIYSPRENTPAALMKNQFIPMAEKKRRFHIFDEIIKRTGAKNRDKFIGKMLNVLVEKVYKTKDGKWKNCGRSREFYETDFIADKPLLGQEVDVKIVGRNG